MFKFIKQTSFALLRFGGSLARVSEVSYCTKYINLNHESCITRSTNYCPFMVILDRLNGGCNTLNEPSGGTLVKIKQRMSV